MAAGGPRARAVAAAKADIVMLSAERDEDRVLADNVRTLAADRADDLEFVNPVFVVGDEALRGHCGSWGPTWPR